MAFNLKNRSFLKEIDFQPVELRYLQRLAESLKLAKYAGTEVKHRHAAGDPRAEHRARSRLETGPGRPNPVGAA